MRSVYVKIATFILMAGLLAACGTRAADSPVPTSQPAKEAAPVISSPQGTEAPIDPPAATDTSAPPATESAAQGATVSFANDVLPILQSRCTNCHGGDRTEKGLNLKTYDDLMAGSENGPIVTPGNAADSQMVELVTNQKMPKRGPKLTPPQVQLITEWVNQGALNN